MEQAIRYVNCPYCSSLVEVVSPEINKDPIKVKADKNDWGIFHAASSKVNLGCPNCGNSLYVYWYYNSR